jgi:ketosteroid isomerase-like protein
MDFLDHAWDLKIELQYRNSPEDKNIVARNRQTLRDALDALVAGKVESFWSIFDPDVVFHEAPCLPYGGAHKGLEATKEAVGRLSAAYSSMRTVFEEVLAAGNIAIAYQTITFRVKENGNTCTLPVAELYRFRNGKVVEWRALYFDSNMVAQAITGAKSS